MRRMWVVFDYSKVSGFREFRKRRIILVRLRCDGILLVMVVVVVVVQTEQLTQVGKRQGSFHIEWKPSQKAREMR